jgi:hypothetical protein
LPLRRTHPSYLSDGEAARESARTSEMVRGFLRWQPITSVGETTNFSVDYDRKNKLILVYGKEIPRDCAFKLAFNESETSAIIKVLTRARTLFGEY